MKTKLNTLLLILSIPFLLCNVQILNAQENEILISKDLRNNAEKLDLKKVKQGNIKSKKKWKEIIQGYDIKYLERFFHIDAKTNFWGTEEKGNDVKRISFYLRNKDLDSVLVEFESNSNYIKSRRGLTKIDKSTDWTLIDDNVEEYGKITPVAFPDKDLKFSLRFLYKSPSFYRQDNAFNNVEWSINNSTNKLTVEPSFGKTKTTITRLNGHGLTFSFDDIEIAAIQFNGEGMMHNLKTYLWISKDLDSNQKLIFSALAILLKHSSFERLKIHIESIN